MPHLRLFACSCTGNILLMLYSNPFLNTGPCHRSRVCLRNVAIGSMLASLQMPSFFMLSYFVLPQGKLSILISVICIFLGTSIFFLNCPTFRLIFDCWLYYGFVYFIFDLIGILLSHILPILLFMLPRPPPVCYAHQSLSLLLLHTYTTHILEHLYCWYRSVS